MLQRILALLRKEFLTILRDPKSRIVLIIPPILQLLIFSHAATLDVKNVSMGILNQDNGPHAFELIQRFKGSPTFTDLFFLSSPQEIEDVIDNQRAYVVLHIDEQFSRNLTAQKKANIQLILDGRKSNTAQIIAGYATSILNNFSLDTAKRVEVEQQNTRLVSRNWFNPNLIYYWFNVPNLSGILTLLISLTLSSLSVARERELGTFDQLLVSPLQPIEILIGKMLPALVIGMLEGAGIVAAAIFLFHIPFTGSLLLLGMSMMVFICSIIGVGLFISSLCSTQQQTILGSFVFMTPAVLLSGYATPIENMPDWLQIATFFDPLKYYLVVAKGVFLKDMPAHIVFEQTWPMAIIALCTLTASAWLFKQRLE